MAARGEVGKGRDEINKVDQDYTYLEEHWAMYEIVESLQYIHEINLTLYVKYTSVTKKK